MQERALISQVGKATVSQGWPSLPVQLTSFVGREQEIATVCELLSRPQVRLLTLIGPGGVGKTRLGLQVATRLVDEFDNQVYFLSLMETNDPELVIPMIGRKLGLQGIGSWPILDLFKASLKEKRLLLLLDNFEQVVEAAPALLDLLGSCSGLKILVTSRTILHVSGEYEFRVSPLAFPTPTELLTQEELLEYPATALFLERARTILPEISLNDGNAHNIAEICVYLDGLPLAIELAVPRLKFLSPQTLLKRLNHRFQILTYGMKDVPERQQTLNNTLEWSYHLLSLREQQLFCALSIFAGGCTFQAIEAVWELAGHEQGLVLEGVASLLDKSMLYRSMPEAEEPRLLMLRMMREYGLHHLTLTEELEKFQWAHAKYYVALAEEAELESKGSRVRPWRERLERERDNLHEALGFLVGCGESETSIGTEMALRLGKALERFRIIGGGDVIEGRDPHSHPPLHDDLTPRERDVLHLVALGLTDAEVAERLVISPRTVNFHLTSIYRKLQVSSRSAATRYILEYHLGSSPVR